MLNVSATTRVFVAIAPVDLRGSFNRLFALTQSVLQQDPLSGHWFVFSNRARNRVKVLFWDGSGLWVCAKRLERGRFTWPASNNASATLRGEELPRPARRTGGARKTKLVSSLKNSLRDARAACLSLRT